MRGNQHGQSYDLGHSGLQLSGTIHLPFLASIGVLVGSITDPSRHSAKSCLSDHSIFFTCIQRKIELTVFNVWRQITTVHKNHTGRNRS